MIIFILIMKIIKLNAIDSTNTFLKELCRDNPIDNFTVVYSDHQLNGRGQMNSNWDSEPYKNLTFSILVKFPSLEVNKQFYISMMVSLAIYEVVKSYVKVSVTVKWPNDIMTANKKVCGILIENSVKRSVIQHSIIGIGLNVNQEVFMNLPNATSLKNCTGEEHNLDLILKKIIDSIQSYSKLIYEKQYEFLKARYVKHLYKFRKPSMFKYTIDNKNFMGIIVDILENGKLHIELENEKTKAFDMKEIEFLS